MSKNDKENVFSVLQLPPLDSEISKLITISTNESQNLNRKIQETKLTQERLQTLFNEYMKKCERPLDNITENITNGSPPSLNFAYQKLTKLIRKHLNIRREINGQIGATISVTSIFFSVLISKNIPATFDFEGFHEYTENVFKKNKGYTIIPKKIKALQSYYTTNKEFVRPFISFDDLCKEIPKLSDIFNTKYFYAPTSSFDILLENFLISNNFMPILINICKDLSGNGQPVPVNANSKIYRRQKLIRMNPSSYHDFVDNFIKKIKEKINDIHDTQIVAFKHSLLRILFNEIYLHDPLISAYDLDFQKNAYAIMHLTPDDLSLPPVFKEEERKLTFQELFSKHDKLKTISNILTTLQFFTDPLDIAYEVSKVSTILNEFAAEMFPSGEVIKLSFDDFFILFVVCISSADIPNSEGIRLSLEFYSELEASQSLHHALTSLSAAIKFVKDLISGKQIPELIPKCTEIIKSFK